MLCRYLCWYLVLLFLLLISFLPLLLFLQLLEIPFLPHPLFNCCCCPPTPNCSFPQYKKVIKGNKRKSKFSDFIHKLYPQPLCSFSPPTTPSLRMTRDHSTNKRKPKTESESKFSDSTLKLLPQPVSVPLPFRPPLWLTRDSFIRTYTHKNKSLKSYKQRA